MKQIGIVFTLISIITAPLIAFGQTNVEGKYILADGSGNNYVLLRPDKTFKYRYISDIQWDLACGQYELKKDSIFFHYTSDMFDFRCNDERVGYSDTSGFDYAGSIDKRFRPIIAVLSKRKLMTVKTGDVQEPETIMSWSHFYIKEKERKKNRIP